MLLPTGSPIIPATRCTCLGTFRPYVSFGRRMLLSMSKKLQVGYLKFGPEMAPGILFVVGS